MAKPQNPGPFPVKKTVRPGETQAAKPRSPFSARTGRTTQPERNENRPAKPRAGNASLTPFPAPGKAARPAPGRSPSQTTKQSQGRASSPAPVRPVTAGALGAFVSRRASERIRQGHLWVYSTDIESLSAGDGEAPSLLPVADNRGLLLGTALYSASSQIELRMIAREAVTPAQWLEMLATRLRTAIQRRRHLLNENTNACRLVYSEADNLPGLIVDKYAGIVVVQLQTKGLDNTETREVCARVLAEELKRQGSAPLTIWERPDPRIRELEGLSAPSLDPLFASDPKNPQSATSFLLNGLSFHFDINSGQKTGAFLDQRENYSAAAQWAKSRGVKKALDICTYQGGFSLHLARVCRQVTGVDASRASLEVAERNLESNRDQIGVEVDWVEADAFELLRAWSDSPDHKDWDLIVLDPPAFAKSKRAVEGALRGYKELNLRALKMLRPGGLLITCSCSHHVSWTDLEGAVASAAIDAGRRVTLLERRGASQDHPVLLNLPETEYLKCLVCQVD